MILKTKETKMKYFISLISLTGLYIYLEPQIQLFIESMNTISTILN